MAEKKDNSENNNAKIKKPKSPLIGSQAVPTVLDTTTKIDIDTNKEFSDNIIDAALSSNLDTSEINNFTSVSNSRDQIYQLIDTMMRDSSVASIVKTYAEDVCEPSDNGHIVWCESTEPKISKFINYLLNVMNVDKYIFKWAYSLVEYGDVYLRLYRESDYKDPLFKQDKIENAFSAHTKLNESIDNSTLDESIYLNIHKTNDPYSYYIEMVPDPSTMFELVKLGKTYGYIETPNEDTYLNFTDTYLQTNSTANGVSNFKMKSSDVNIYQADDFVHACLEDNYTRYPEKVDIFLSEYEYNNNENAQAYSVRRGKSMLYDSYKIWREKSLLEDSILLNRLTKSSFIRMIQVEVGDMPKSQVQNTIRRIKNLMEQKTSINANQSMSESTNPGPIENNIYLATHEGKGSVTINTAGGEQNVKDLADLDYWVNKFYSSYGIPKQYMGWTDDGAGFNGGSSLSIISSVYAKAVKRIQNALLQALTDAINLFLINKGCKSYLNNFVLKMKAPSTQEEKDYRESLSNRINAISNLQSLFSDVEDKSRKLEILKALIVSLNYGSDLSAIIDQEIDATKAAAEKEAAEAAAENESTENISDEDLGDMSEENAPSADLGNSGDIPMESLFNKSNSPILVEEGADVVEGVNDDLPTPNEINERIDFSRNI